jgi:hypothetical protein
MRGSAFFLVALSFSRPRFSEDVHVFSITDIASKKMQPEFYGFFFPHPRPACLERARKTQTVSDTRL